jgi:hypothetical protein
MHTPPDTDSRSLTMKSNALGNAEVSGAGGQDTAI